MVLSILVSIALIAGRSPANPVGVNGAEPQIASSGSKLFLAYGSKDSLYVVRSTDGGSSYADPIQLLTHGRLSLGMRRGPRIAAQGSSIVVTAIYGEQGGGKDGDLLAWSSTDQGVSWQGPTVVSDVPGSASEGLQGLAASPSGQFCSVWLDHRSKSAEVWISTSKDAGKSWSKNTLVYHSPDRHVCECCHPSAAYGPKGELYIMYRNWLGGSRDMYLSESTDGGLSFQSPSKLGEGTWPLNACPMDGGGISVDSSGVVSTAWRKDGEVFIAKPGESEVRVAAGTQPWISTSGNQVGVVWLTGTRIWAESSKSQPLALGAGRDPVIVGVSGHFVAAWADEGGRIWSAPIQ